MKKILISAVAVSLMSVANIASAQVTTNPPITVSSTPMSSSISPGTSAAMVGTFNLSGGPSGTTNLESIPLTLTTSAGGQPSDLTNCQILNPSGTSITSVPSSIQSGTNTFQFSPVLSFTGNSVTTYTIRCNVSSSASTTAIYAFSAGQPSAVAGSSSGTTAGSLSVGYVPSSTIIPGIRNLIGVLTLNPGTSGVTVRIASIPMSTTFSGGVSSTNLRNCSLAQISSITAPLNSGVNAVTNLGTQNTFTLDTPVSVAGSLSTLALLCDVDASAPVGSSVGVSVTPSGIPATDASNGALITPTGAGGASIVSGTSVISVMTTPTTPAPTTPGVPNTGAGGKLPENMFLLVVSALIATGGVFYLWPKKKRA